MNSLNGSFPPGGKDNGSQWSPGVSSPHLGPPPGVGNYNGPGVGGGPSSANMPRPDFNDTNIDSSTDYSFDIVKPPVALLFVALFCGLVGIVCGALFSNIIVVSLGWVFSGLLAIGVLCAYILVSTNRQGNVWYTETSMAIWMYRVSIIVCLAGVIACAIRIALYMGRL